MTSEVSALSVSRSGTTAPSQTAVYVLGSGGHARSVAAAFGLPIDGHVGPGLAIDDEAALRLEPSSTRFLNGIGFVGSARVRRDVHQRFQGEGFAIVGVRHPFSMIDPTALVADDSQVLIGAVLGAGASIGSSVIVNSGAIIEHDVVVGAHSHVGPGAILCGDVVVGEDVFIGAGAVVLPGVTIGAGAVIGAGSVLRDDLDDGLRAAGSPARLLGARP